MDKLNNMRKDITVQELKNILEKFNDDDRIRIELMNGNQPISSIKYDFSENLVLLQMYDK